MGKSSNRTRFDEQTCGEFTKINDTKFICFHFRGAPGPTIDPKAVT